MASHTLPTNAEKNSSRSGWWFLPCVILSGLLFAGIVLSPRFVYLDDLRRDYFNKQLSLLELEADCLHQEKINRELRRNPEFAKHVSLKQSPAEPSRQKPDSIPLNGDLEFDGLAAKSDSTIPQKSNYVSPQYLQVAREIQLNPLTSQLGMLLAGLLLMMGFVPVTTETRAVSQSRPETKTGFLQRYRKPT